MGEPNKGREREERRTGVRGKEGKESGGNERERRHEARGGIDKGGRGAMRSGSLTRRIGEERERGGSESEERERERDGASYDQPTTPTRPASERVSQPTSHPAPASKAKQKSAEPPDQPGAGTGSDRTQEALPPSQIEVCLRANDAGQKPQRGHPLPHSPTRRHVAISSRISNLGKKASTEAPNPATRRRTLKARTKKRIKGKRAGGEAGSPQKVRRPPHLIDVAHVHC
ncbi:hypothetical protein B0H19DRAFT_1112175 [Mycena capillaripes]|nr:hypothetical protein B0H19DRAFT_1112175 [Mycena capillaripes]